MQRARRLSVGPLTVVIPLSIRPAPQPGLRENPVVDLALFLERDLMFEYVDLSAELIRNAVPQLRFPL